MSTVYVVVDERSPVPVYRATMSKGAAEGLAHALGGNADWHAVVLDEVSAYDSLLLQQRIDAGRAAMRARETFQVERLDGGDE